MTIADLIPVLHANVLTGEDRLNKEVGTACCSDLMSDVLAFVNEKTVLVTGLTNPHVMRTANMLELKCLIFVRGKTPTPEMLAQADEQDGRRHQQDGNQAGVQPPGPEKRHHEHHRAGLRLHRQRHPERHRGHFGNGRQLPVGAFFGRA